MTKLELVQKIGNEVCEGCGESRDCGLELDKCMRIHNALVLLDKFIDDPEED